MPEYRNIFKPSVAYLEGCGRLLLNSHDMGDFLGLPTKAVQRLASSDRIPLQVRLGSEQVTRWNVLELAKWVQAGCPGRTAWIQMNGKSGWCGQRR